MKSAKNIVADIVGIMAMDIAIIVLLIKNEQRGERKAKTMDDLISRQAVIDLLKKSASRDIEEVVVTEKNIKLIMDMPKAFDVDAVIDKLEEEREYAYADFEEYTYVYETNLDYEYDDFFHKGLERAIRIVKAGGING